MQMSITDFIGCIQEAISNAPTAETVQLRGEPDAVLTGIFHDVTDNEIVLTFSEDFCQSISPQEMLERIHEFHKVVDTTKTYILCSNEAAFESGDIFMGNLESIVGSQDEILVSVTYNYFKLRENS